MEENDQMTPHHSPSANTVLFDPHSKNFGIKPDHRWERGELLWGFSARSPCLVEFYYGT